MQRAWKRRGSGRFGAVPLPLCAPATLRRAGATLLRAIVVLALLTLPWPVRPAEALSFDYALGLRGPDFQDPRGMVMDAAGNLYIFGDVLDRYVDVDPGPNVVNVASQGEWDVFVAKYSQNGALLWSRKLGGDRSELATGIATDGVNVYITGQFWGSFNIGGVGTLTSNGLSDIFVVKLNADGSYAWARSIGGAGWDEPRGIAVGNTSSGVDVLVTGRFASEGSVTGPSARTVDFDPGPGTFDLTATSGSGTGFILKLTSAGTFRWASKLESSLAGGVFGDAIAEDSTGAVYVTGITRGTIDFDPGPGTVSRTFDYGTFVLKLDPNGAFVWVDPFDGHFTNVYTETWAIATSASGNVYVTGGFTSTIDFDPGPGTFNLTSVERQDVFVVKLDQATGALRWARAIGGEDEDQGYAIAVDSSDDVFVTGTSWAALDFDPGPGTFVSGGTTSHNAFVWKLDANGDFVWARAVGGPGYLNLGHNVVVSPSHTVYVYGQFQGAIDFDPGPGNATLTPFDSKPDLFIWRLTMDGPTNTVPPTQNIVKNTDLVFSTGTANQIAVTASEAGSALGITLTAVHGTLKLANKAGLTFASGATDATMTFTGPPSAVNTALDGLRFIPDTSYVGGAQLTVTSFLASPGAQVRPDTDKVTIKIAEK